MPIFRAYGRQGGKQRAIREFLESLPEDERRNVRHVTRADAEEAQQRQRQREAMLAEILELDEQWYV